MTNQLSRKLHWYILASIVAAALVCTICRGFGVQEGGFAKGLLGACDFGGGLFLRALKMVIVPLVATSIVSGMLSLGGARNFGKISLGVLAYYTVTTLAAVLMGLGLVNIIKPGHVSPETAKVILGNAANGPHIADKLQNHGTGDLVAFFQRMIPDNIVNIASDNGQLLGLIVFCLIFGFFISKLPNEKRDFQDKLWSSLQDVMMLVTQWIIAFSPLGVFCLILPVMMRAGLDVIAPLFWFFMTVILGLTLHMFGTLSLLLWRVGHINPLRHLRTMLPVLITSFSTSSSSATIPVTMETVEKDAGVSNKISSFVLPLGATINMDGTALYECVVVIFIAQFYGAMQGFEIGLSTQFIIAILALLTSVGVAGIPSASLVAIALILGYVGLPLESIGIIWLTDRILDMCRTSVNVYGDTCGAVIIARLTGEKGVYPDAPKVEAEPAA
jgi:proton glutamate symport protein